MRFDIFAIKLDNAQKKYNAGETVTGKVLISSIRERVIQGIILKSKGYASVHLTENLKQYTNTEIYFDNEEFLAGKGDNFSLAAGNHEYSFSIKLPIGIPNSYKSEHGQIHYSLKCEVKQSFDLQQEISTEEILTIKGVLDLNANYDQAILPREMTRDQDTFCICFNSGKVGFQFRIYKSGFIPGEDIKLSCLLYNNSSNSRKFGSKVELIQETIYMSLEGKFKTTWANINGKAGPDIGANDCERWEEAVKIPNVEYLRPTNFGGCKIIKMSYFLKLEIQEEKKRSPKIITGVHNIIIGTIQLKEKFQNEPVLHQPTNPKNISDLKALQDYTIFMVSEQNSELKKI